MNKALAENCFTLTQELFTEGMLRVWAENTGKYIKRLLAFLGLAWIALTVFTLLQSGSMLFSVLELLVLALVVLWAAVYLPRHKARRAYKAMEERGGADAGHVTRFYADRLEVNTEGRLTAVDYSKIQQTLQSKNLLIFIAGDKTGVLVRRGSFTLGTEDEVLRLIKETKKEADSHD